MGWAHVLVDRAAASVERVALRGQHFVAMAEVMLGREPRAFAHTQAELERVQERIACDRIAQAQRHMAMARVREQLAEANVQRKMAMVQMKMDRVRAMTINRANRFRNCDGLSKVVVNMPDLSNMNIEMPNLPDIQVPDIPEVNVVVDTGSGEPI
jgi:hypothetical protein